MWKIGVAAACAVALLIVLAIQLWPGAHRGEVQPATSAPAQQLSRVPVRTCAREVLNDWVRDGRIDAQYRRGCYQAALASISGGDMSCLTLYGGGSLCEDLQARLETPD